MSDMVKSPDHYTRGGIECKDAIEAALTPEEFRGWCKGNAIKYVWREQFKNGDEDLAKARQVVSFALEADEKPDEKPERYENAEKVQESILDGWLATEREFIRISNSEGSAYPNFRGEAQLCAFDSHCCGKLISLVNANSLHDRAIKKAGELYLMEFAEIIQRICDEFEPADCKHCPICKALGISLEDDCHECGTSLGEWVEIIKEALND